MSLLYVDTSEASLNKTVQTYKRQSPQIWAQNKESL